MALTRKMLTAMGIEGEKIDQIIEAHTETVDALKAEKAKVDEKAEELRQQAAKVPALEKEIEDMKESLPSEDWEAKYNEAVEAKDKLQGEFDAYKETVASEKADAEKAALYRALLGEVGVDPKRIDSIMKVTDLSGIAVKDGAIDGADELKESIAADWADFIPQKNLQVPKFATPPKTDPTEDQPNPRAVEIAKQRHERLYGAPETKGEE